ncbi:MAG: hypothetical protein ABI882_06585 [Acidobacteriota bacterium]
MAENCDNNPGDFFEYLADSFWASLPPETAESLAKCKKDSLTWIKDTVTCFVEHEISKTEEHLKNAQRMRDAYPKSEPPAADASQPS